MMVMRGERGKAYEFVMGLDDYQFGAIRIQTLAMVTFPSLTEAKNIIDNINMSKPITMEEVRDTKTQLVGPTDEEVFDQLQCTRDGLTSEEATHRLKIFGPNVEKNKNKCLKLFGFNVGPKCMVLRDNKWKESKARVLVPGDIISIKFGDTVPADARLIQADSILVDQYVLTRESLPVTRGPGDMVFSGSTCKQGQAEAIVLATGVNTFF